AVLVLSLLLERKNELAEAEMLARQGLAMAQRIYGADNSSIWGHLLQVGALCLDRGDLPEAERLLRQALSKSRIAAPGGDPDQGDVLNRLAFILVGRGAVDAGAVYRDAV